MMNIKLLSEAAREILLFMNGPKFMTSMKNMEHDETRALEEQLIKKLLVKVWNAKGAKVCDLFGRKLLQLTDVRNAMDDLFESEEEVKGECGDDDIVDIVGCPRNRGKEGAAVPAASTAGAKNTIANRPEKFGLAETVIPNIIAEIETVASSKGATSTDVLDKLTGNTC